MTTPLILRLPEHYQKSPQTKGIQDAFGEEAARLQAAKEDVIRQLAVQTATWGLVLWEEAFGLVTDQAKPLESRRAVVLSKLRGQGTCTPDLIRAMAESFGFPSVDVMEYPGAFSFEVVIFTANASPERIAGLEEAINEVKPAHLVFWFTFQADPFHADIRTGGGIWTVSVTALPPL